MVVSACYTAIAVIGALTLSAARRRREEALLRTLGLSGGQSLWLTVVEHAPSVLLAVLPGLALGIGIACLLAPGMGLSAFAGGGTLGLRIDWWVVGLVSLGAGLGGGAGDRHRHLGGAPRPRGGRAALRRGLSEQTRTA